jgi:hypothetical protein
MEGRKKDKREKQFKKQEQGGKRRCRLLKINRRLTQKIWKKGKMKIEERKNKDVRTASRWTIKK